MCDRVKKISFQLIIVFTWVLAPAFMAGAQNPTEVKAIQLFNSGRFTEAEPLFQNLLEREHASPFLSYYYAAARTENGHFGERELEHLKKAGKNITPDRLHYYLALQYHAQENWDQALKNYNQFRVSVPETEQEELELGKKIQLCYNQQSLPDAGNETADTDTGTTGNMQLDTLQNDTGNGPTQKEDANSEPGLAESGIQELEQNMEADHQAEELYLPRQALPNLPGVKPAIPAGEPVQFQVNQLITYLYSSQFQTEEGKKLYYEALKLKADQEKNLKRAEELRRQYTNSKLADERETIAAEIISLENDSYSLDAKIKAAFNKVRLVESEYWENAGEASRNDFLAIQQKLLSANKEEPGEPILPEEEILIDYMKPAPEVSANTLSDDLVYKIQIGAFSKGVPAYLQKIYKKLSMLRTIESYTDDNGVVVYTTGNLARYEDAVKMQSQVKQEGIKDASVVPYYKGKRITLEQAKLLVANNDI